jgi:putative transposase
MLRALSGPAAPRTSWAVIHTDHWDPKLVRRAYKLRAYPTRSQEGRAVRLLRDHCDLYNAALQERREAWRMRRVSISYGDQSAQLREIRAADPAGQGRHSFTAQQQTLRRLSTVFASFYKRARDTERQVQRRRAKQKDDGGGKRGPGYPRFKPYQRFDQVLFVAGDGAKWEPAHGRWAFASFQAVGRVKVKQYRALEGRVKTLQLKREHRRWYVIVVTETAVVPLPVTGRKVGIDMGTTRFLTTSDGEIVDNPRFLDASHERIADLQRRKARTWPGSGNRKRLRRQLAREWRKVCNRRRDFHHKEARKLVNSCDAIGLEDLRVDYMTRRSAPKLDPETPSRFLANGATAKAGLNRSILDAGWGQFTRILTVKAASAGRRVILVNPAGTSIDCHACGTRCIRPRQDTVICPTCGPWDADSNGARNIFTRAGLGSGQVASAA